MTHGGFAVIGKISPSQKEASFLMPHEPITLQLTPRQAQALRALAALEDLPPEVYAAEVLAKHLYHAYTPDVQRAAGEHTRRQP